MPKHPTKFVNPATEIRLQQMATDFFKPESLDKGKKILKDSFFAPYRSVGNFGTSCSLVVNLPLAFSAVAATAMAVAAISTVVAVSALIACQPKFALGSLAVTGIALVAALGLAIMAAVSPLFALAAMVNRSIATVSSSLSCSKAKEKATSEVDDVTARAFPRSM